jgi:hypothetical protein
MVKTVAAAPQKKKKVLGVRRPGRRIAVRLPSVRNKLGAYAGMSQTPIRWIVGHGTLLTHRVVVPPKTFVVFLAQPGFLTSTGYASNPEFLKLWTDRTAMSQFIRGEIQGPRNEPFQTWHRRVYGPGDRMPDTYVELFDLQGSGMRENTTNEQRYRDAFDQVAGVKRVGGGHIYHGLITTVGRIIRKKGAGIYFVYACRGTVFQHPESLERVYLRGGSTPASNVSGFIRLEQLRDIRRTQLQAHRKRHILKV